MSIIIHAAINIEGRLSQGLEALCRNKINSVDDRLSRGLDGINRKNIHSSMENPTTYRLREWVLKEVEYSHGLKMYDELLRLLTGTSIFEASGNSELTEAVNTLFKIRNMLVHGRPFSKDVIFDHIEGSIETDFVGSYAQGIAYLMKSGKIDRLNPNDATINDLLQNSVADWAWDLTENFLNSIVDRMSERDDQAVFVFGAGLDKRLSEFMALSNDSIASVEGGKMATKLL